MDFNIVARAGLTQAEFAALCGVSRVTANTWVGGAEPNRFLVEKVRKMLAVLLLAIDAELLPLVGVKRPEREAAILQRLKAAIAQRSAAAAPADD